MYLDQYIKTETKNSYLFGFWQYKPTGSQLEKFKNLGFYATN